MKEKVKEFNVLMSRKNDKTVISLSEAGFIDIEEMEDKLDELHEEIEDLKSEIDWKN